MIFLNFFYFDENCAYNWLSISGLLDKLGCPLDISFFLYNKKWWGGKVGKNVVPATEKIGSEHVLYVAF